MNSNLACFKILFLPLLHDVYDLLIMDEFYLDVGYLILGCSPQIFSYLGRVMILYQRSVVDFQGPYLHVSLVKRIARNGCHLSDALLMMG